MADRVKMIEIDQVREKLIALLLECEPFYERDLDDDLEEGELETIADHLIANGVTIQNEVLTSL